jgi:hypothetical protein
MAPVGGCQRARYQTSSAAKAAAAWCLPHVPFGLPGADAEVDFGEFSASIAGVMVKL